MNQVTKKQHYVWRHYLAPWASNHSTTGKIACLRDNRIFTTSLFNVAHENYFYKAEELSEKEKRLILMIANRKASNIQKEINERWLELFCVPYDLATIVAPFLPQIKQHNAEGPEQALTNMAIEYIEKLHGQIEGMGIPFLEQLKQEDTSFWCDEDSRDKFTFYLCNQYFRTKLIRNRIVQVLTQCLKENPFFSDIHPDNMWIPLSLIFATNVGIYIAQNFSAVLLRTNEDFFIVGDQPVVNTYSTFDMLPPTDIELFYPITPELALLLTQNSTYLDRGTAAIGKTEVSKYNMIEFRMSEEQVFARNTTQLEDFVEQQPANF